MSLELCLHVDDPYLQEIVNVPDSTTMEELIERFKSKINEIDQYMIFWAHFGNDCDMLEFDRERITEPISKLDITNQTTVLFVKPNSLKTSQIYTMSQRYSKDEDEDEDEPCYEDMLLQWINDKKNKDIRNELLDDILQLIKIDVFFKLSSDDVVELIGKRNSIEAFQVVIEWIKYQIEGKDDHDHVLKRQLYSKFTHLFNLHTFSASEKMNYIAPSNVLTPYDYVKLVDKNYTKQ